MANKKSVVKITAISDLHGYGCRAPGGDILIVGGDWTKRDTEEQCFDFFDWVTRQPYTHKIVIAGNHDNRAQKESYRGPVGNEFIYLCDSGIEIEGIKFWGTPWTKRFKGQSPYCMAFCLDTDEELKGKWDLIPDGTDILISHSPPFGILDETERERTGCKELLNRIYQIEPTVVIFGHIHENGGKHIEKDGVVFINASHVNEEYDPINLPITFEYSC